MFILVVKDKAKGLGLYKHLDESVCDGMWMMDKQHGKGTMDGPGIK
jgi:hypothetical protein